VEKKLRLLKKFENRGSAKELAKDYEEQIE
jgi:hypothetical protein